MNKYDSLIGKKINLVFGTIIVNSYKITRIVPTDRNGGSRGQVYDCDVEWKKKIKEAHPVMGFDTQTLEELATVGRSNSPIIAGMYFIIENDEEGE